MKERTFAEKIFNSDSSTIVFAKPDLILTHDNTSSIYRTFRKMGGTSIADPNQILIVLDHNAPPPDAGLANQYQEIRNIVAEQGISKFYDAGEGICHQIMSYHAMPGMLIVGSDSHTSTAGAFNAFAAGIDRTESAGIWKQGETWFRVPESMKISLTGELNMGVTSKDLALWIIGMTGSDGANYLSVEFHGDGIRTLSIADRMTLANMASEMGAKNAVFPADEVLMDFLGNRKKNLNKIWADEGAGYVKVISIDLNKVVPVVAAPHNVDNIMTVSEVSGTPVQEGLIGTCTNGRIEDLRVAAEILKGKKICPGFQLNIIPASRKILLQAIEENLISSLVGAGASLLPPSCGPCLGTGLGIPASGHNVISTANRNFPGRMGNREASVYLASPATVAASALTGMITDPRKHPGNTKFGFPVHKRATFEIKRGEKRRFGNVWDYSDVDNLNTDQMFAGKYTYNILSSDPASILPHLFEDFDPAFREAVKSGDIIIAGENFGCGSSREHPSAGLSYAGIRAVIVKSVNRIFFRSSVNQGLMLMVHKEAVESYRRGDAVTVDIEKGELRVGDKLFRFGALPDRLRKIMEMKGLVNYLKSM